MEDCFRPQQGLTIINGLSNDLDNATSEKFPSPTGVNYYEFTPIKTTGKKKENAKFPSPTGVNYYESA